jgi:hypothetical protein
LASAVFRAAKQFRCRRQRSSGRQNSFAVGVGGLPDGKTVSPLASAVFRGQNSFAVGVGGLPGGKTVSLSASALFQAAKRFRRRRPSFYLA